MKKSDLLKWAEIIAVAGLIDIYASVTETYWLELIFKPGTMLLIFAFAFQGHKKSSSSFTKLILLGLFFGLLGDLALAIKGIPFVFGLGSFLICHLLYIAAFIKISPSSKTSIHVLPYAVFLFGALWFFLPQVGDLVIPVTIYMCVIVLMGWRAFVVHRDAKFSESRALVIGSLLFMLSDTILAYNKFVESIWMPGLWIMATYFAAQFFIAKSTFSVEK